MKKIVYGVMILAVVSTLVFAIRTVGTDPSSGGSNVLVNGDFETGTFVGWDLQGECSTSNTVVHNGSYCAYISDGANENMLTQILYTRIHLTVDSGIILEGWVYPSQVGWISGQYPWSAFDLNFYNVSIMRRAFQIIYTWCVTSELANFPNAVFLPMNASEWNHFSVNVTADFYSIFGNMDYSDIVLYAIHVTHHFSMQSPGAFYVDDLKILTSLEEAEIHEVSWVPTCPPPYVPSVVPRVNEPILVTANVTGSAAKDVLLKFRRQNEQWFNVSMLLNEKAGLWTQTMPGQSENCTIEFFIEVQDTYGRYVTSSMYSFSVKALLRADMNGDGKVNVKDVVLVSKDFGKKSP